MKKIVFTPLRIATVLFATVCATALTAAANPANPVDAEEQFQLADRHLKGRGVPQNTEEAVKWLKKAVEQGHSEAQVSLGWCYSEGKGVPKNDAEAMNLWHKAAAQGNTTAQANIAYSHWKGEGVPANLAEAVKWYKLSAKGGNPRAQFNLGMFYENGWGVPVDTNPNSTFNDKNGACFFNPRKLFPNSRVGKPAPRFSSRLIKFCDGPVFM